MYHIGDGIVIRVAAALQNIPRGLLQSETVAEMTFNGVTFWAQSQWMFSSKTHRWKGKTASTPKATRQMRKLLQTKASTPFEFVQLLDIPSSGYRAVLNYGRIDRAALYKSSAGTYLLMDQRMYHTLNGPRVVHSNPKGNGWTRGRDKLTWFMPIQMPQAFIQELLAEMKPSIQALTPAEAAKLGPEWKGYDVVLRATEGTPRIDKRVRSLSEGLALLPQAEWGVENIAADLTGYTADNTMLQGGIYPAGGGFMNDVEMDFLDANLPQL